MRDRALAIAAAVVALLAPAPAQEKPNFAGHWVLVIPSESAGQAQRVTHDGTTLTTAHGSSGDDHRMTYKLDGSETRNVLKSHGSDIVTRSTASWTGARLTITSDTTYPDGRTLHAVQVWSLDGDRLTVESIESGLRPEPRTMTLVYARAPKHLPYAPR